MINRERPPFDDPRIRRAMALTVDRQAFMDILNEGQGQMSGAMLPPPDESVGADAGNAEIDRRLRRRRQGARRDSRPDEAGRLRAGQAARDQGQHVQHLRVSRPGGDPHRSAEADLDRGGARGPRHRGLLQPRLHEGFLRGDELQRQRGR
ncbi:ABC transporter substrate-binding protein [Reyranella soli]|uniref:ABC transporter substrate-binding protein n=1 Tax=Reyranella soli TaxID=1230389 RepID=UPI001FE435E6|nr:ABC transporter substrate-binding protein [Reyranella soli]